MSLAFFEIGAPEMFVVGFVALLLYGGRLPEVMRGLGTTYRNFRRGMDDLKSQAMRPDLTIGKPAAPTTPYRPQAMPLPPTVGVPVTPPSAPAPPERAPAPAAAPRVPEARTPPPPADDDPPFV
jgi:TatA/E family protein of Tat protein translocase